MGSRPDVPMDADALSEAILRRCRRQEDGALGELLWRSLRAGRQVARDAVRRPKVKAALSRHVSGTQADWHALTATLLRTLRQVDPGAAAEVVAECDVTALARTLSYVVDYTSQQVVLLARLYACNPQVGRRVFCRCGSLLKDFLAHSSFAYLDLPEDLLADVEQWRTCG